MKTLGFIGMGNMASAIAAGMLAKKVIAPQEIFAFDLAQDKLVAFAAQQGINACANGEEVAQKSDIVILCVKPQYIESAVRPLKELLKGKAVLSIALGWDFAALSEILDASTRHLFIMPNTPALVGEGVLLFEEKHSLFEDELALVKTLFSALGRVETLPSALMGIGGTISGCSPAFVSLFIEALADAAVLHGMPRDLAYALSSQAVLGTGKLQLETGMHPAALKDMVCSPKGSTILGVAALEETGLRASVIAAVNAAMNR